VLGPIFAPGPDAPTGSPLLWALLAVVRREIFGYNPAPRAVDDTVTTSEDTAAVLDVLRNDVDTDCDPLTVVSVTQPANGTATVNADGTITYRPNADFNGADTFTYRVSDGNATSNTATVKVTVKPVNDAPIAANDSAGTAAGTPV